MKVFLVLLYLWSIGGGEVELKYEKTAMPSMEACNKQGLARIDKLAEDPRFEDGLFAGCVNLSAQEAKK